VAAAGGDRSRDPPEAIVEALGRWGRPHSVQGFSSPPNSAVGEPSSKLKKCSRRGHQLTRCPRSRASLSSTTTPVTLVDAHSQTTYLLSLCPTDDPLDGPKAIGASSS
jgi:hypothetical protein